MTANQLIDNLGILYCHLGLSNNGIGAIYNNCPSYLYSALDTEIDIRLQEIIIETWGAHWLMADNT